MALILDDTAFRLVLRRISECSNPLQLRSYLKKYIGSTLCKDIGCAINERIAEFKNMINNDPIYFRAIEDIYELMTEV